VPAGEHSNGDALAAFLAMAAAAAAASITCCDSVPVHSG